MTNGKERVLVHYICIIPELRRQNIGAVLMKSIFRRDEYHEKDIMAITSLPKRYRHDGSYETMVRFFTKFDFKDMSKNMKDGENDIDGEHTCTEESVATRTRSAKRQKRDLICVL